MTISERRSRKWHSDLRIDLPAMAHELLQSHCHFRNHCNTITVSYANGQLILCGRLPSFHLKQLAQEALKEMTIPVVNQIMVVSATGLSS